MKNMFTRIYVQREGYVVFYMQVLTAPCLRLCEIMYSSSVIQVSTSLT